MIAVLVALVDRPAGASVAEVARAAQLAKPTAHRLLQDLCANGFVRPVGEGGVYAVTLELPVLAGRFLRHLSFLDLCQPELDRVARHTGELVRLAWRDGDRLVFLAEAQGAGPGLRYDANLGRVASLHTTAVGKCFLASLPPERTTPLVEAQGLLGNPGFGPRALSSLAAIETEIARVRRQGFATALDEGDLGAAAVAVAIEGPLPETPFLGSVAVIGPAARAPRPVLEGWVPELRAAALAIARLHPVERFCRKPERGLRRGTPERRRA